MVVVSYNAILTPTLMETYHMIQFDDALDLRAEWKNNWPLILAETPPTSVARHLFSKFVTSHHSIIIVVIILKSVYRVISQRHECLHHLLCLR